MASWNVSLIGGRKFSGPQTLPGRTTVVSLVGGVNADLTEATIPAPGVELVKVSLVGGVNVKVPPGVRVEVSGFTLLGGRKVALTKPVDADAPVLWIKAFGIMGGVSVTQG